MGVTREISPLEEMTNMIGPIAGSTTVLAYPTRVDVTSVAVPTPLDTAVDSWAGAPMNGKPATQERSIATSAMRVLMAAGEGAFAGYYGGTIGGVIGGLSGAGEGASLGWSTGSAVGMHLAKRAGQGKGNPVAAGLGALTLPLATGTIGLIGGATAMAVAGASGNPLLGAAIGGGIALATEIIKHQAA